MHFQKPLVEFTFLTFKLSIDLTRIKSISPCFGGNTNTYDINEETSQAIKKRPPFSVNKISKGRILLCDIVVTIIPSNFVLYQIIVDFLTTQNNHYFFFSLSFLLRKPMRKLYNVIVYVLKKIGPFGEENE